MMNRPFRFLRDRDRLSYWMVVVFGFCLLVISIAFQLGYSIYEESQWVRGLEMAISLLLMLLGAERLWRRNRSKGDDWY